jgi:hypothetical protein
MNKYILYILTAFSVAGWEPQDAAQGDERKLLAAVIIAEAGSEGKRGCESVYEVIWQRASLGECSYTKVLTKRKQFSCLNGKTPAQLVLHSTQHPHYKWVEQELLRFPPLTMHTVPSHLLATNRNRADHYYAHKICQPYWSTGKGKRIGNHTFEKLR